MTANTDPVRALIDEMTDYLDQEVDPELDVIEQWRDRLEAAIASAPQQPAAGEEIMVNAAHDVFTLPLQPSGLTSGPRFVVHVPGPRPPEAVDEAGTWSKRQPTCPGIYGIRGFNLCRPASEQFEAVVVVREHGGELVCNLHESTSEDDLGSWAPICDLDPDFEWRAFAPGWEQQGGPADG